jgi:hypothetical protein
MIRFSGLASPANQTLLLNEFNTPMPDYTR